MTAQPQRSKPSSYPDIVQTLNDQAVQQDVNNACTKLAQAMTAMKGKFEAIAKQIHTVDLLRHDAPLKPRWDLMRKDLADMLRQFRTNACMISGRLKLFNTMVLPMAARTLEERCNRFPPYNDGLQVLRSYMTLSEEHSAITKSLVNHVVQLSSNFMVFVSDFTCLLGCRETRGQNEMCNLTQQLSDLKNHIERLLTSAQENGTMDDSRILFTSARLVLSSGQSPGRSKITRRQVILHGDLGRAYESTDRKRNEVAHVQYAANVRQCPTDPLSIAHKMLCAFLLEKLLIMESALSFFLSIWSQLQSDCIEVFQWLKDPTQTITPVVISYYLETKTTLYTPVANALDVFAAGP